MGLLDFLRRRADGPDAAAPAVASPEPPGLSVGPGAGPESHVEAGPESSVESSAGPGPEAGPEAVPVAVPPAWSLLPPLQPLSHQPIHRTFDTGVSASLRAHRRADQLLATAPLGHTVDPSSAGVVHGLLQATGADPVAPMTAGPDLVLRRKVLTPTELPEADQAHPRWPAWVRSSTPPPTPAPVPVRPAPDVALAASSTAATAPVGPVARWADTDGADTTAVGSDGADADGSGADAGSVTSGAILDRSMTSTTSAASAPDAPSAEAGPARSLPLVAAAPVVSTVGSRPLLTRLADPAARSLERSPARTADGEREASGAAANTDTALPLVAAADPGAAAGPSSARLADPVQPSAVLRRRGIVEVPIRRLPTEAAAPAAGAPADATVARTADITPTDAIDATASASPVAAGASGPDGPDGTDGSAASGISHTVDTGAPVRPTLGRGGLGQPLSALPATALRRAADDTDGTDEAAFGGAAFGGAAFGGAASGEGGPGGVGSDASGGDVAPFAAAMAADSGTLPLRRTADEAAVAGATGVGGVAPGAEGPAPAVLPVVGRVVARTTADGAPDGVADGAPDGPLGAASAAVGSGPGGLPVPAVMATLGDRPIVSSTVSRAPSVLTGAEPTAATVVVPVRRGSGPGSPSSAGSPSGSASGSASGSPSGSASGSGSVMRRADASGNAGAGGAGSDGRGPGSMPGTAGTVGWATDRPGEATGPVALARLADPAARVRGPAGPSGEGGPPPAASEGPFDGPVAGAVGIPLRRLAATGGDGSSTAAAAPAVLPVVQRVAAPSGPITFAPGLAPTYSIHSSWDGDRHGGSGDGSGVGSGSRGDDGGSGGSLQRSADDGTAAAGGAAAAENPAAAAVQSPGGAPAGGSTAQADSDLDLLAGRLYDRIRFRLRRELLDDRERAGLVLDRMR